MSKLISICIPCFNEEKSLLELGERLKKLNYLIIKKYYGEIKLEVILINNGSEDYSSKIICSVEKENIFGTQFHPEKSDKIGLQLIENFINL